MRKGFFATLAVLVSGIGLHAEPAIQRHFKGLPNDYRLVLEVEYNGLAAAARTLFDSSLLEEARLESLSHWRVEGDGFGVRLEVFQLSDPSGAYQLFSHWQGPPSTSGLRVNSREGVFWQSRFLFRMTSEGPALSKPLVERVRSAFVEAIAGENTLPVPISHLPREGRDPRSIRYYLGAASLGSNSDFPDPLLDKIGFNDQADAASARYPQTDVTLFIVAYPTVDLARDYIIRLQRGLKAYFSETGIFMARSGLLVAIAVGPKAGAETVLASVRYSPSIEWIYDVRAENAQLQLKNFLALVKDRMIAIGIVLTLLLGAGTVVGVIRYEMLQRFPGLTTRTEMVELKLDKHSSP